MYRRAYPPRNTPLPENYSGIALLPEEDTAEPEEQIPEETADEAALPPEPTPSLFTVPEAESVPAEEPAAEPPKEDAREASAKAAPLPPSFATSDMLLLAIAALMTQSGQADGELLVILLLLLLSE